MTATLYRNRRVAYRLARIRSDDGVARDHLSGRRSAPGPPFVGRLHEADRDRRRSPDDGREERVHRAVGRDLDDVVDRLVVGTRVVDRRGPAPGDAIVGRARQQRRTEAREGRGGRRQCLRVESLARDRLARDGHAVVAEIGQLGGGGSGAGNQRQAVPRRIGVPVSRPISRHRILVVEGERGHLVDEMRRLLPAFAMIRRPAHQHGGAAAAERCGGRRRIDREVEEERRAVVGIGDPGVGLADERPARAFRYARRNRIPPVLEIVGSGQHANSAARGAVIPPVLLMRHQDPSGIRRIHRDRRFDGGVWEKRAPETRLLARDVVTPAIDEWVADGHPHQWTEVQLIGKGARHQGTGQNGQADEGVSKVETGSTIFHFALPFRRIPDAHQRGSDVRRRCVVRGPLLSRSGTKPTLPRSSATSMTYVISILLMRDAVTATRRFGKMGPVRRRDRRLPPPLDDPASAQPCKRTRGRGIRSCCPQINRASPLVTCRLVTFHVPAAGSANEFIDAELKFKK